ncbi:MAG: T9SS type A sorting domain-containing protein [Bacteroidales bacterium]|nr:T9SS type A sorting domain-containing protein [Bacteroidales bacterium]
MKTLPTILLIIALPLSLFSQTFEKLIKTQADDYATDAIELSDGNFLIAYNKGNSTYNDFHSEMWILNKSGDIIQTIEVPDYNDYKESAILNLLYIDSTTFIGFRSINNNITGDWQTNIIRIKNISNIYYMDFDTIIGNPEISMSNGDFILTSDKKLVSVGYIHGESNTAAIYITDLNGNYINSKIYYGTSGFLGTTIMEIPQKNKYHMFEYWDNDSSLFIIDKESLEIDTILHYPQFFLPRNAVKGINQNSYFVAGQSPYFQGNAHYIPSFIEINNNGEIININKYLVNEDTNSYYTINCFDHLNGKIYFGAVYNFSQHPPFHYYPERRWIFINKLNSDGSIIWQHFYKGEVNYMPFKVLATKDGGALILSTKYDWEDPTPNQFDLHILKIDSTGWYDGITGTSELMKPSQILVYPNPVKDKVNFVPGMYRNLNLQIFNSSGKLVIDCKLPSTKTINMSQLAKGVYIFVLSNNKGFIEKGKIIKE